MAQNTSHAVMAQRAEPNDSLDDFPTPSWGTRALLKYVLLRHLPNAQGICWEPAANRGHMARTLSETFNTVYASDVHDYGNPMHFVHDFLWPKMPDILPIDWIITNPPFRLAEQFIARARDVARVGCAMLVRTSFLESVGRYERLFSVAPPTLIAQFAERLPMVKGRVDQGASTATSYCWIVWSRRAKRKGVQLIWIPPCRANLERDSDYQ